MIKAVMIGAGNRGLRIYGSYAVKHPENIRFVAVAEKEENRRRLFQSMHHLSDEAVFHDAKQMFEQGRIADVCFICSQDRDHLEHALMALDLGYHLLLEKPMALTAKDLLKIEKKAEEKHCKVMVAHVLRYTLFFKTIKEIIEKGKIGNIISIQHNENVGYFHQAHSYVRGNWRNDQIASPMILAKSCHDMDLLVWLMGDFPVKVSSFGSLSHFRKESMLDVPDYCLDGCRLKDTCPYEASQFYLNAADWMKFPVSEDTSDHAILSALKRGPYGRCVYRSDNNVVDHQVVSMVFSKGQTATFQMSGFTHNNTRTLKIMGTEGEIRAHMENRSIEVHTFGKEDVETIDLASQVSGHGGGDQGILVSLIQAVESDRDLHDDLHISVLGHMLAFASEEARITASVIDMDAFIQGESHGI